VVFFVSLGWPDTTSARWVTAGMVFSLVGDVALLGNSNRAFLIGLGAFLLAHVIYIVAFLGVVGWSPHVALVAPMMLASTLLLLRAIWKGAAGTRGPAIAYAVAVSVMVVSAWATIRGPLAMAPFAAVGATLFYVSDSSLALSPFPPPIPHIPLLAMGVYWLGQLGIAIAASASF